MIETILVPTDFTVESEELLVCVGEFKNTGLKKVILLHVVDIYQAQGLAPMFEENAKKRIGVYKELLNEMRIAAVTFVIHGDVNKTIVRVADEENVDCIVMGATTSGMVKGRLIGRTTEYISRSSGKIVLIEKYDTLRESEEKSYIKACSAKFSKVMLPVDLPGVSGRLLEEIGNLKDIIDELVFVHVIENAGNRKEFEGMKERSLALLSEMGSKFVDRARVSYIVTEGRPAEAIDMLAEEMDVTLIAITTHGVGSFKDILLGSTAESLLRRTRKPVLLIPSDKR
jgi:nucleotide-binding universal stress UspA family protein